MKEIRFTMEEIHFTMEKSTSRWKKSTLRRKNPMKYWWVQKFMDKYEQKWEMRRILGKNGPGLCPPRRDCRAHAEY